MSKVDDGMDVFRIRAALYQTFGAIGSSSVPRITRCRFYLREASELEPWECTIMEFHIGEGRGHPVWWTATKGDVTHHLAVPFAIFAMGCWARRVWVSIDPSPAFPVFTTRAWWGRW